MVMYQSYNTVNTSEVKPNCPQCYQNDCIELVDATQANQWTDYNQTVFGTASSDVHHWQIVPVWRCARCSKVFSDRTPRMASEISLFSTGGDMTTYVSNGTSWQQSALETRITGVEMKLNDVTNKVNELVTEIQKQKEDVLHALRNRINNFNLE